MCVAHRCAPEMGDVWIIALFLGSIKWEYAMSLVISFINILGRMCDGLIVIYIKWFTYRELCII